VKKVLYRKNPVTVAFLVLLSFCALLPSHGFAQEISGAQLTGIDVTDNTIIIKANAPFAYNISQPADPFRSVIDIDGVGPGRFRDKIYPKNSLATEISPSGRISPPGVRLDLLLQAPAEITPELKDNSLVLLVAAAPNAGFSPETVMSASPVLSADGAKAVTSLSFSKTEEGTEMIIKGNGPMPDPSLSETEGGLILDIPGVVMRTTLPSKFPAPLRSVRQMDLGDRTRFLVETIGNVESDAFALDDEIILDISPKMATGKTGKKDIPAAVSPLKTNKTPEPISLDFQDADIVPILRLLGDVGGYNIVIHPDVKGNITMKLLNVPWDQAMDIILRTFSLEKIVEGNVIRVTTLKAFQEEQKAIAETRAVFGTAEPVETRVFILNYAEVDKIKESIASAKILSARGNISVDARTRSIVVKDVPSVLSELDKLVIVLDKPTPQVLIEARIVEVSNTMARSLGVEWGFKAEGNNASAKGSATGRFPETLTSLPASTTSVTTPSSAMTFGYLNAAQTLGLDLRLSAIAEIGRGKIISNPKVVTTDNQKAKIIQGESIPYGEVTPGSPPTVTTKFKDVALIIEVTPKISNDGTISMNVVTTKEELVEMTVISAPDVRAPRTTKIEGNTSVLIKNGETMVIGGIYRNITKDNVSGVPGLMDIPLLGRLFRKDTVEEDTREILIFITPRLVKQ
jgi:type IV pilus assembly protein PilQ